MNLVSNCVVHRALRSVANITSFLENLGSMPDISSKTVLNAITRLGVLIRWRQSRLSSSIADLKCQMQLTNVHRSLDHIRKAWQISANKEDFDKDETYYKSKGLWMDYSDVRDIFEKSCQEMWAKAVDEEDLKLIMTLILLSMMCLARPSARTQTYCNLTIGDIRRAEDTKNPEYRQVQVLEFKTASVYKTLFLSMHRRTFVMIDKYLELRKYPTDREPLFINTARNTKCSGTDLHRYLHTFVFKLTEGSISLSINSIRKAYRTAMEKTQCLSNLDKEFLDSADTHSTKVVNQHYNKVSRKTVSERADDFYLRVFESRKE